MSAPGVPFPLVANPIKLSKAGSNLPRGPAAPVCDTLDQGVTNRCQGVISTCL